MSGMPSPAVFTNLDPSLSQTKLKKHHSILQMDMQALEKHSMLQVNMKAPDKLHTCISWLLVAAVRVEHACLNIIYIAVTSHQEAIC